jgi:hypothetical protein
MYVNNVISMLVRARVRDKSYKISCTFKGALKSAFMLNKNLLKIGKPERGRTHVPVSNGSRENKKKLVEKICRNLNGGGWYKNAELGRNVGRS